MGRFFVHAVSGGEGFGAFWGMPYMKIHIGHGRWGTISEQDVSYEETDDSSIEI